MHSRRPFASLAHPKSHRIGLRCSLSTALITAALLAVPGSTSAQPYAFLSAPIPFSNDQLLVLDTSDDTFRNGTRFGDVPSGYNAVAFSDRADLVFLAPTGPPRLEVIALQSQPRRIKVPITGEPLWLDALPDASKIYVSHPLGVDVVDLEARNSRFILNESERATQGVVVNHAGDRVYVAVSGEPSAVVVIDPVIDRELARWDLPGSSNSLLGIAVHPDGSRVYVADFAGSAVAVLDTADGSLVGNIPILGAPRVPTLTPTGDRLFVSSSSGLVAIDTATNLVVDTVAEGNFTTAVDVHPDGTRVYTLDLGAQLSIYSTDSLELLSQLPIPLTEAFQSGEFIAPAPQ